MGFKAVYDTSFAADLTVIEEANEFIERKTKGEQLPQFTSCCPALGQVRRAVLPRHSATTSRPAARRSRCSDRWPSKILPERLGIAAEDLVVVSIMPCTAKKYEAKLAEVRQRRPARRRSRADHAGTGPHDRRGRAPFPGA